MTLKLGNITTIVVSSPQVAREVLQKNDQAISSRKIPDTLRAQDHHTLSVIWMPQSPQWRLLRRVCASKIFSSHQLDSTQTIRQKKVQELVNHVGECCRKGEALAIGEAAFTTVLNSISNILFSLDLGHYYGSDHNNNKAQEFNHIIWGIKEEGGGPNVVDFFSMLRVFDPQRARARMNGYFGKLIEFLDGIIDERLRLRASEIMESKGCNYVLDSLIQLMMEENSQVSRPLVLHLLLDLFVAGMDTTSSTVEWTMAELLCNLNKLKTARQDLHKGEPFEESHISRLPFLKAVNSQILINVWAMGRDPSVWENPNQFMPEKFLGNEIDFKGQDFELLSFGAGRRMCPGLPLTNKTVHAILASILHYYDWKLANGSKAENMDMAEKFRVAMNKAIPLRAIPIKN
ncbi:geraniol 8-hydroxylase-like [Senna tora]|uniref:Geraniol 8-hydroxylase-like n=1 Tax=Senna tora TaxID=362788 RepID=A0A834XK14_9FABA|nr:geraniol 8-hydroxylase-like [Senna tora]